MIGSVEVEIPDLAEPITAWRSFRIAGDSVTPYLSSMNGTAWPPNGTGKRPNHNVDFITASCTKITSNRALYKNDPDQLLEEDDHPCPCPPDKTVGHAGLGCGIYAFKEPIDLAVEFPLWGMSQTRPPTGPPLSIHIWGKVELWGHVYDHSKGYRAEHGRIVSLLWVPGYGLPLTKLKEYGDIYGVPVVKLNLDIVEVERKQQERREQMAIFQPVALGWFVVTAIGEVLKEELVKWFNDKKEKARGRNRKAN